VEGGDFEGCGVVCGGQGMPCLYDTLFLWIGFFFLFCPVILSLVPYLLCVYFYFYFYFVLCC